MVFEMSIFRKNFQKMKNEIWKEIVWIEYPKLSHPKADTDYPAVCAHIRM